MASALIQIPEINVERRIKPEKVPGGGFIHAVCFKLPVKAEKDGYIIQLIIQEEIGTQKELMTENRKDVYRRTEYWEAWEVKKGETEPQQKQSVRDFVNGQGGIAPSHADYSIPMNDIFYKKYALGSKGNYTISGLAGFYQESLPTDFIVAHPKTGAYALKSTIKKPEFWSNNGLFRQIRFSYDCETEARSKDDSVQRLNPETPRVLNMSFFDPWMK